MTVGSPLVPRVLVVEDEELIAEALAEGLELEGYRVEVVSDGDAAEEAIAREAPDVIVLDLILPGRNGLAVLEDIHHAGFAGQVVILSARNDVATRLAGLRRGACDYMVKPYSLDELIERIRIHTGVIPLARRGPVMVAGAYALGADGRTASFGDRTAVLTEREAALLVHLMRHSGRTLGREEILASVWMRAADAASNVVEVNVASIRRKLGAAAIRTVRGAGYALGE